MPKEVTIPREQIEKRAYELYLTRGCEPGKELEDWLAAEAELKIETKEQEQPTSVPKIHKTKMAAAAPALPA